MQGDENVPYRRPHDRVRAMSNLSDDVKGFSMCAAVSNDFYPVLQTGVLFCSLCTLLCNTPLTGSDVTHKRNTCLALNWVHTFSNGCHEKMQFLMAFSDFYADLLSVIT